ncbi:MAG: hypothetical protein MRK02_04505 [Candidatus Scalindua sp.]|nr:hypothetical protein [Candidatus Scalindua sp.]
MKNVGKTLVLLDTDRIHDFVFATNKLKEIRGASAILNELNLERTYELMKGRGEKIFLGGGSGKLIFGDISHAHDFCRDLEEMYKSSTAGEASITTAIVPYDDSTEAMFMESLYRGEKELRKNKDFKYQPFQLLSDHYFKVCESSGIFPAEIIETGDNKLISAACSKKREIADEGKNSFFEEFVMFVKKSENTSLGERIERNNWHTILSNDLKKLLPGEINSLASISDGYIGLIYADGNRMGQRLQNISNIEEYTTFSDRILVSTKSAIFEALAINLNMSDQFPFEILLLGGDDLLVIVPADKAIAVAIDFCDNFRVKSKEVSMSAGVVIAHANYPIHQMIDYGKQLLKSAKKKGSKNQNNVENYIDFMVIKNSVHDTVPDIRENNLEYESEDGYRLRLFQRPYTTDSLGSLIKKISRLKNEGKFPRSRLKQMYKSLFRGKNQAMLDYCLLLSRLDKDTSRKVMMDDFFAWCDLFPWLKRDDGLETPFLDLIELYDYIN